MKEEKEKKQKQDLEWEKPELVDFTRVMSDMVLAVTVILILVIVQMEERRRFLV